ncbi:hypothetical protein [Pyrococcus kukulkanii]|uniref:hypothetical protein n=1 Tax=Pyrococcus kukulkanii TaxID=1609559 RepID=UPI0035679582
MVDFEEFKDEVVEAWRKGRLPSYIRRVAIDAEFAYSYQTRETYVVAWIPLGGKVYVVDIEYSKRFLELEISELPKPLEELKTLGLTPLLTLPGKTVYRHEVRQNA